MKCGGCLCAISPRQTVSECAEVGILGYDAEAVGREEFAALAGSGFTGRQVHPILPEHKRNVRLYLCSRDTLHQPAPRTLLKSDTSNTEHNKSYRTTVDRLSLTGTLLDLQQSCNTTRCAVVWTCTGRWHCITTPWVLLPKTSVKTRKWNCSSFCSLLTCSPPSPKKKQKHIWTGAQGDAGNEMLGVRVAERMGHQGSRAEAEP